MPLFNDQVQESIAPWDDPGGFWSAYNAALAGMFEEVFDIVADTGDPSQTVVGILSGPLSTAVPITSLPVQSLSAPLTSGTTVTLAFATFTQAFVLSANGSVGDATVAVISQTPNFAYPTGTPVQLQYVAGWSSLLDAANCPDAFLPFLAQFNGAIVPIGLDDATARAKIVGESGLQRGTLAAVVAAVKRNLTGTQSVVIFERTDSLGAANAYWFVVIVRPEEVISVLTLTDAVNAVKPGGVQWTLVQTDGWILAQMEPQFATIAALEAAFATLGGLESDIPGH